MSDADGPETDEMISFVKVGEDVCATHGAWSSYADQLQANLVHNFWSSEQVHFLRFQLL